MTRLTVLLLTAASTMLMAADSTGARVPLEKYLQAHATGQGDFIRQAFHPDAKIMSIRDGKLMSLTAEEFAARFNGKPAPDEAKRKRWIDSVEVIGDTAVGKIILDYPNAKLTDYMALHKIGGDWKIVHKSFQSEPKAVK